MKREFLDYIEDIIEAMNNAMNFARDMKYDDFTKDNKTIYAMVRALEIIGEAVKNLSDEVKQQYPQIPWRDMAGMRDKLIHEYFGVNKKVVWDTIKDELPKLKPLFEKILEDFQESE